MSKGAYSLHRSVLNVVRGGAAMSTDITRNADRWRRRAEEMRRIADGMTVIARAKAEILRIAENYDLLAMRAERRLRDAMPAS